MSQDTTLEGMLKLQINIRFQMHFYSKDEAEREIKLIKKWVDSKNRPTIWEAQITDIE